MEASIAARQYSLVYIDYPEATEFEALADEYVELYQSKLKGDLKTQGILNLVINLGRGILTGDINKILSQGISGYQTLALISRGEDEFGKETAATLVEDYRKKKLLVEDQAIVEYIQGIAARMAPYMGRTFDYEYYIVKDSNLNASALPGGKIFVNTGAILQSNSEAELAGLIGHEISHAVLSHGYRKAAQTNLFIK